MAKNKRTLLTVATHGDEGFSLPVVKRTALEYGCTFQINNPRALAKKVRYVDCDMNRCAPGKRESSNYEEKKVYQNIQYARSFDRVIDVHGSVSDCGLFLILSDASWQNIELAKTFDVANVVLWPSLLPTGPLTQFIPNSLEVECGPMYAKETTTELERVLSLYLSGKPRTVRQQFYIVTGSLQGSIKTPMKDFVETSYKGKTFIPLLVDQYTGIKCYMLQKLDGTLLDSE